jgi:hypothetical protein
MYYSNTRIIRFYVFVKSLNVKKESYQLFLHLRMEENYVYREDAKVNIEGVMAAAGQNIKRSLKTITPLWR